MKCAIFLWAIPIYLTAVTHDMFLSESLKVPMHHESIPKTQGFLLTHPDAKLSQEFIDQIEGVEIVNLKIPGNFDELKQQLQGFLDQPLTMDLITQIKQEIIGFYQKEQHSIVAVIVPEQDVTEGTVTLHIVESKVGNICFSGNKWFKSERLREYIHLQEDESINNEILMQDLFWLNRNPFRESQIILKPGELEGTTDVEFWTKDRFPVRPYVGVENTGFEQTGTGRVFTGINWGNAFGSDQILSYQYTSSLNPKKFYAHTGHWTVPISRWQNILEFFGGYSKVRPDMPIGLKNTGENWQVSGRYTIPFKPSRLYLHELQFGVDYKRTNNNIFFFLVPLIANTAVITQVMGRYSGNFHNDFNKTSFDIELFWSPGDLFAHQSARDYQSLRPFAKSDYVYARGHVYTLFKMPYNFSLSFNSQFQVANRNLLPSEEFGIGGYTTVRGYEERELNFDNAFVLSTEIRTPPYSLIQGCRCPIEFGDVLQFLLFLDYGVGNVHKKAEGATSSDYLLGIGPGIRYNVETYLTLRADVGFKLHRTKFDEEENSYRFHFSFLLSY